MAQAGRESHHAQVWGSESADPAQALLWEVPARQLLHVHLRGRLHRLKLSLWGPPWPQAGAEGGEPVLPVRGSLLKTFRRAPGSFS